MNDEKIELAKRELSEITAKLHGGRSAINTTSHDCASDEMSEIVWKSVQQNDSHGCNSLSLSSLYALSSFVSRSIIAAYTSDDQSNTSQEQFAISRMVGLRFFLRNFCFTSGKRGGNNALSIIVALLNNTESIYNEQIMDYIQDLDKDNPANDLITKHLLASPHMTPSLEKALSVVKGDAVFEWLFCQIASPNTEDRLMALRIFSMKDFSEFDFGRFVSRAEFWTKRDLRSDYEAIGFLCAIYEIACRRRYISHSDACEALKKGFHFVDFERGFFILSDSITRIHGTYSVECCCILYYGALNCISSGRESNLQLNTKQADNVMKRFGTENGMEILSRLIKTTTNDSVLMWACLSIIDLREFVTFGIKVLRNAIQDPRKSSTVIRAAMHIALASWEAETRFPIHCPKPEKLVVLIFNELDRLHDRSDYHGIIRVARSFMTASNFEIFGKKDFRHLELCLGNPETSKAAVELLLAFDMSHDFSGPVKIRNIRAGEFSEIPYSAPSPATLILLHGKNHDDALCATLAEIVSHSTTMKGRHIYERALDLINELNAKDSERIIIEIFTAINAQIRRAEGRCSNPCTEILGERAIAGSIAAATALLHTDSLLKRNCKELTTVVVDIALNGKNHEVNALIVDDVVSKLKLTHDIDEMRYLTSTALAFRDYHDVREALMNRLDHIANESGRILEFIEHLSAAVNVFVCHEDAFPNEDKKSLLNHDKGRMERILLKMSNAAFACREEMRPRNQEIKHAYNSALEAINYQLLRLSWG